MATDALLAQLEAMRARPRPIDPLNRGSRSLTRQRDPWEMGRIWTPEQMASAYDDPTAAAWMLKAVREWEERRR